MVSFRILGRVALTLLLMCAAATAADPTISTTGGSVDVSVGAGKVFSVTCPACEGKVPCIGKVSRHASSARRGLKEL